MPAQDEEAFVHHDQHHHHSFGHDKPRSRPNEVHLLIREASGLTKKLASHLAARSQRSVPVLLDGPYGGVSTNLAIYEHVVLIAGGAGVTFIMPVLQDLVDKMSYERSAACKVVDVVWSVKETGKWRAGEVFQALRISGLTEPVNSCFTTSSSHRSPRVDACRV